VSGCDARITLKAAAEGIGVAGIWLDEHQLPRPGPL
jgi:hypothetical protein